MKLLIRDESATGSVLNELTLDFLTETITVRELIRSRIYQEVDDHNLNQRLSKAAFKGLVTPKDAGESLTGGQTKKAREVDWKDQFEKACDAFNRNSILVLVDERQAESLDETIALKHDTLVSFIKLTPLVGG